MIHGRQAERAALTGLLQDAREGRARALVLRGEAGIGKSTLLRDTGSAAADFTVLRCAGVETEVRQPFSGLHQLLHPVSLPLSALSPAAATAVRHALSQEDGPPGSELLVCTAVLDLLGALAAARPLLVLVDDLHWLDRSSATALVFAARRLSTENLALLLAVRSPDESTVDIADLAELPLSGLSAGAAAELLAELDWPAPEPVRAAVLGHTGGNPLALVELAALGSPGEVAGELALHGTVPVGARIRAAFQRRLHALPEPSRSALLLAAAEDSGHTAVVLGALPRLGLPADALDAACAAGLVDLTGPELRFRHPLVRSVAYAQATFPARAAAHRALAEQAAARGDRQRAVWHRAVAATEPDEELAGELERIAESVRGRGGEAAVTAVLRHAARLSSTAEGRRDRLLAAAFVALDSGQPELARELTAEIMAEPAPVAVLARLTATVEAYSGDPDLAWRQLQRCADLLKDPLEAAWTLVLAANCAYHADDVFAAHDAAARIAGLDVPPAVRRAGEALAQAPHAECDLWGLLAELAPAQPAVGGRAWMWVLAIGWLGPDPRQALAVAEAARTQLRAVGSAASLVELLFWQADLAYRAGDWDAGVAAAEEGLRLTHETGQRGQQANLHALLARYAAARGEAAACREHAERALALAVPMRQRAAAAVATHALALLALAEGDPATALDRLIEVVAPDGPRAHRLIALHALPDLAEAANRLDRAELLNGLVGNRESAGVGAELRHVPWVRATVQRVRALATGEVADHELALTLAESADRPFELARAALQLGARLRRDGQPVRARQPLSTAVDAFTRLGARPWAEAAAAELRAAGAGSPARGAAGEVLSPQELAVARLAARGLSNREIGDRLFLSPRTVGSHLYRLFPKLGIISRAQLRDLPL
ncbi:MULTISPECIES: AAA family ATPase [unclassified Crossiella]|uniref:AAA family ATPase n=1 Tax=unclassified Crossiella TaxID=2620835 RepID=UPI001FFF5A40|nr:MULTISPECIES: AAA family ATPase [unclassified Crossiella]MCK2241716.1 AAA family ATPase [Crossiella sp. S99.2]MCK2255412.1 AAA family ATPase [Crossiella sp. S99.1]